MRIFDDCISLNVVPGKFFTCYYFNELENSKIENVLIRLNNNYQTFCNRMELKYEPA